MISLPTVLRVACAWALAPLPLVEVNAAVLSHTLVVQYNDPPTSPFAAILPGAENCGGWIMYVSAGENGGIRFDQMTLGMGYAWFVVEDGFRIDASLARSNPPFGGGSNAVILGTTYFPVNGAGMLFGYFEETTSFEYDPGFGDCYGWARLSNNNGSIVILDDAVETTGIGIFAGTLQAVPEPSSGYFLMVGSLLLLQMRRTYFPESGTR